MKDNYKEPKEKQVNPIVQRTVTNPSVGILRCSLQQLKVEHEKVTRDGVTTTLHHYTLTFSEDTLKQLEREGAFENQN